MVLFVFPRNANAIAFNGIATFSKNAVRAECWGVRKILNVEISRNGKVFRLEWNVEEMLYETSVLVRDNEGCNYFLSCDMVVVF